MIGNLCMCLQPKTEFLFSPSGVRIQLINYPPVLNPQVSVTQSSDKWIRRRGKCGVGGGRVWGKGLFTSPQVRFAVLLKWCFCKTRTKTNSATELWRGVLICVSVSHNSSSSEGLGLINVARVIKTSFDHKSQIIWLAKMQAHHKILVVFFKHDFNKN